MKRSLPDKRSSKDSFTDYMLDALERSSEYSMRLRQESYNAIQLLLGLLAALSGGVVVILSNLADPVVKLFLLLLAFVFAGGFGSLTYIWVLSSMVGELSEQPFRFFLTKYFRDLDPTSFEEYGVSELLGVYRRYQNGNFVLPYRPVSSLSLLVLGIFSSIVIGAAVFIAGYLVLSKWSFGFSPHAPRMGVGRRVPKRSEWWTGERVDEMFSVSTTYLTLSS